MNKKELFEKYSSYEYEYDILSHPDITYDEAKVILELRQDPEIKMIFNSIYGPNREIIKAIKKIANDKKVRNAFIKISNKLNKIDEFDGEELLPKLNDDYFVEYINIIDDDNITRNISIYSLLFKYSQDTEVDNFLENPKLFNIYVNDNQKRYYNLVYGYLPSLSFSFKETYNPSVQFSNLKDLRIYFYKLGKITY